MDLIVPIVDDIILMKEGEVIAYDDKDTIISDDIFENLNINKPKIYSIFNKLKKRNLFGQNIPISIRDAINLLKSIN
jgi:ABC-type enterochelin transport system ATPase subunit